MGPSPLEERVTNSSLIEVSESLIPYDFIVTSLGANEYSPTSPDHITALSSALLSSDLVMCRQGDTRVWVEEI